MKRFLIKGIFLLVGLIIATFLIIGSYFNLFEKDYLIYDFSPLKKGHYFLFFGDEYTTELKSVKYSYLIDISNYSNEILRYEYEKGVELLTPLFRNKKNGELFSFLQFKKQGINFYQDKTEMKQIQIDESDFVWFQSFYLGDFDSLKVKEHEFKRDSIIDNVQKSNS